MNAKEYTDIEPRMLTQKQAEVYTGMGRKALNELVNNFGAKRRIGRRVLFDKRVIDEALDALQVVNN